MKGRKNIMFIKRDNDKVYVVADKGNFLSVDGNKETILKDGIMYEVVLDARWPIPDYIEIPIEDAPTHIDE